MNGVEHFVAKGEIDHLLKMRQNTSASDNNCFYRDPLSGWNWPILYAILFNWVNTYCIICMLTFSLIRQFCSRRLWTYFVKTYKISITEWITYDIKWKTLWQKEKLYVLCNFFFCYYVFIKPSAAEASESVYMRERVNLFPLANKFWCICRWWLLKHCDKRRNCSLWVILPQCF